MRSLHFVPATGLLLAGLSGGCDAGLPAGQEPHRELNFLDMADQAKLKPQRGSSERLLPPPGAVAVDYYPYPYAADQGDLAGRRVKTPLQPSEAVVAQGKFVFENVCIVCHGPQGAGDGEVAKLFPKPPSLMTQRVRDWPDGRMFHVPMRGQGSMPSYAKQLSQEEMWAVMHYIRSLQKELPVAPPDPNTVPTDSAAGGSGGAGGAAGAGGADVDGGAAGGAGGGQGGAGGAVPATSGSAAPEAPAPSAEPKAPSQPTAAPAAPPKPPPQPPAPPAPPKEPQPTKGEVYP
ncbi:MAG: cytochrome c [Deltaproteobacteria bacterium]|nr:cytochrome c [Deltaproteobacteria bacterium]